MWSIIQASVTSRSMLFLLLACVTVPFHAASRVASAEEFADRPQLLHPLRERSSTDREHLRAAAMVMEARILEGRGELIPALRKYQRAWRLDRDARIVLKQIVPLAIKLGRLDEATRYALLLANSDLKDPFLAERLAMLMADQVEYDRSLQLYRHVLQLRDEEFKARNPIAMHFEMGRLYFLTKEYEQAAQSFRVVLDAIDNPERHNFENDVRDAILAEPERVYTLFAESFLEAGEYDDALALFERAGETEKKPGWLQLQRARVDFRAGRYENAQEKLEAYVQQKLILGGRTPYALLRSLLEKAATTGRPDTESQATQDEANQDPDNPKVSPGVVASFRDWLADDPDNFPLMSYVAELTRRRGGFADAAKLYEKSVAKHPTIEGYVGLITTYRKLKDKERLLRLLGQTAVELKAINLFNEELAELVQDKELLGSVFELGRHKMNDNTASTGDVAACGLLALKAQQYQVANEFLGHLEKSPAQLELMITWGMQLLVDGENMRALEVFQSTLDSGAAESDESVVLFYLAAALQLDGQTERALEVSRRAAKLASDVPDITLRPAWILYNANRETEAYAAYRRWLDKHAEDYSVPGTRESVRDARFVMSTLCLDQNRLEESIECLERILDEFPSDAGALNDLGYLLVDRSRSVERATNMIRMAVRAEPDNVAYRDSLGWALYRSDRFKEAVVELRKAASVDQPDPIILDHLGDALFASGSGPAAGKVWRQALSLLEAADSNQELKLAIKQKLEEETVESK